LGLDELGGLFRNNGLRDVATTLYGLDVGLDTLLASSFPEPGAAEEIRRIFAADLDHNRLGVGARLEGGEIRFAFPTAVLVGRKAR
jgi:hypothetical protein